MLLEFLKWMFINLMVAMGLAFLSTYPPFLRGWRPRGRTQQWFVGVGAGSSMAAFSMLFPFVVAEGRQLDLRYTLLALTGWFLGWSGAVAVGAVIVAVRIWMGGVGWLVTAASMPIAALVAALFHGKPHTLFNLALSGVAQTTVLYIFIQWLEHPSPPGMGPTSLFWLAIAGISVLSHWLISAAVERVISRHQLEHALAEALLSKEAVLELIPYGVVLLDAQHQVSGSNRAARMLFGHTQMPPEILVHPEVEQALRRVMRLAGCRITYRAPGGADRILLVSVVPQEGGGAVVGMENVTSVVHQEREEAVRDRLQVLGQLASMAAHEIKNPLTTIRGFLQLLERKDEFAAHRSTFALLQGEVEHINRVVGDFVTLAGHGAQHPTAVELDRLISDVLAVMALQHPDSGVQVQIEGSAGLTLEADRKSLHQILRNLITNAYEAMPRGGVLTISRMACGKEIRIEVSDSGEGIPTEMLPLIFRPYMTTKATGTGLGLAISHKLATEMGGSLGVTSEPGNGCTFRLQIPVWGVPAVASATDTPPA